MTKAAFFTIRQCLPNPVTKVVCWHEPDSCLWKYLPQSHQQATDQIKNIFPVLYIIYNNWRRPTSPTTTATTPIFR